MSNAQDWVEALNISPENLSEWSQSVPAETPLLVWCLENGHVPAKDYFAWARETYGLPTLDPRYFENAVDFNDIKDARQTGDWSPWCLPIGHWEDVTYVACVEPPPHLPEGLYALVLSAPGPMRELWNSTNSGTSVQLPIAQLDAPAGMNLNHTSTFQLNLDNIGAAPSAGAYRQAHPEEAPPALETADFAAPDAELETPELTAHEFTAPEIDPPTESHSSLTLSVISEPPPVTKTSIRPSTAPRTTTTPSFRAGTKSNTSIGDPETEIKLAFDRVKHLYKYALIMHCENGKAKPYRWDNDLKIRDPAACTMDLSTPNFLRIVVKTEQLYHGYVVQSPAHDGFFQALGLPGNPACVTAIPLKLNDKLWGMLVALGTDMSQGADSLETCQYVAEKLTLVLGWTPQARVS